jgi:hypothetical protein
VNPRQPANTPVAVIEVDFEIVSTPSCWSRSGAAELKKITEAELLLAIRGATTSW